MKKAMKSISKCKMGNNMSFETKGFEAKAGRTMFTRRPYAKITVSEDVIYLGAAVTVGIPLAVAGVKQVGKIGAAALNQVGKIGAAAAEAASSIFKPEEEDTEDFMEQ